MNNKYTIFSYQRSACTLKSFIREVASHTYSCGQIREVASQDKSLQGGLRVLVRVHVRISVGVRFGLGLGLGF